MCSLGFQSLLLMMLRTHHHDADGLSGLRRRRSLPGILPPPSSPPPILSPSWGPAQAVAPNTGRAAHRAGIVALAGKVIQALVLQLLSDEGDHGLGPVPSVRADRPWGSGTSGFRRPGPLLALS